MKTQPRTGRAAAEGRRGRATLLALASVGLVACSDVQPSGPFAEGSGYGVGLARAAIQFGGQDAPTLRGPRRPGHWGENTPEVRMRLAAGQPAPFVFRPLDVVELHAARAHVLTRPLPGEPAGALEREAARPVQGRRAARPSRPVR